MTTRQLHALDPRMSATAVLLLGLGAVAVMAGLPTGSMLAPAGAVAMCAALLVLIALRTLDGIMLLAVSLPLPAPYVSDELRVAPAAIVTAVLILAWVVARTVDPRPVRRGTLPVGAMVAWMAALGLATVFAQERLPALRELANFASFLVLLVVVTDMLSIEPARVQRIARALAVIAAVAGVAAVFESLGSGARRFPLTGTALYRATLGFGWPNELAMFLALLLPFSFHAYESSRGSNRMLAFGGLLATFAGILATFSRGSWLAILASVFVLLLVGQQRQLMRRIALVAGAAFVLDIVFGGAVFGRVVATATDPYVIQRIALTWAGVMMFMAYPLLGVGPGGFGAALEDFGPQIDNLWDYVGSAHNAYVEIAAETGIVGLVAFLVFLATVFMRTLTHARAVEADDAASERGRGLRRAALWSLAIFCTVAMTAWPLAHGIAQLAIIVIAIGLLSPGTRPEGVDAGD